MPASAGSALSLGLCGMELRGVNKRCDQRMHGAAKDGALGLEEGPDAEGMAGQFHGAEVARRRIGSGKAQPDGLQSGLPLGSQTVTAVVADIVATRTEQSVQMGAWFEHDGAKRLAQRAGQRHANRVGGMGIVLGVAYVGRSAESLGAFEEQVLKPAAGAEEGNRVFTGETNGAQHALGIGVGAAGHAPDSGRAGK